MIKINLLPVRAAKKKETAVQQISLLCVSVVVVAVIGAIVYGIYFGRVSATKTDITTANKNIEELKKKIGKLEALKALKDQVKKKLDVLAQLRKNKSGPAQRLATLSDTTPQQLWLTSYVENGSDIKLSGIAYTEELIAAFMRSLESSADYANIELVVSEQATVGQQKLKKFDLTCKLKTAAVIQPETAPKK